MAATRSLILLITLSLAACGGSSGTDDAGTAGGSDGNGGGGQPPATPTARIVFPPMHALATTSSLLVRGTASLAGGDVTEVRVNGQPVTTTDGYATWEIDYRLLPGANTLTVGVIGSNGESDLDADTVNVERQGPLITRGRAIDRDSNGDLIVLDYSAGILRVDRTDESRELVSSEDQGAGAWPIWLEDMVVDRAANVAYVLELDELVSVDLSTGDRTVIPVTGDAFTPGEKLAIDATGSFAIVSQRTGDVFQVDLATGVSTLLSPVGTPVADPKGVLVLPAQALVYYDSLIQSIDLATGVRTELSGTSVGSGPALSTTDGDLVRDVTDPARLLAMTRTAVLTVDPSTGDRATLSGDGVGQGPDIASPRGLLAVAGGVFVLLDDGLLFVDAATGDRTEVSTPRIGSGPLPNDAEGDVAVEPMTGAVLLADDGEQYIIRVDPETGARTQVTTIDYVHNVTCDPHTGVAYFLDGDDEVSSLNPATGASEEVSGATRGTGPAWDSPYDLSHGPRPGTLVVNDYGLGVVLVDIATGNRSILTPVADFNGLFGEPYGIAADPITEMVFVADNDSDDEVFEIDATTGVPTSLVAINTDFGVDINDAVFQQWDGNVYIAGEGGGDVFRVTPGTGDTVTVSSEAEGQGPLIGTIYHMDAAPETGVAFLFDGEKLTALDLQTGTRVMVGR